MEKEDVKEVVRDEDFEKRVRGSFKNEILCDVAILIDRYMHASYCLALLGEDEDFAEIIQKQCRMLQYIVRDLDANDDGFNKVGAAIGFAFEQGVNKILAEQADVNDGSVRPVLSEWPSQTND